MSGSLGVDLAAVRALATALGGVTDELTALDPATPVAACAASLPGSATARACPSGAPRLTDAVRGIAVDVRTASDTVGRNAADYATAEEQFRASLDRIGGPR